ncbi:restriction endonuclease, partial [Patescibacteria group bacterium]|nr:restriction endonuclease [Patescibacteria group bacterium]
MANEIDLIPELLHKFNLGYNKSYISELIKPIQNELDLEEFEQNLGLPQEIDIEDFAELQGYEFEEYLKSLFGLLGYKVIRTPFSSDQGADLIALKDNKKTVVQAKKYTGKVSNSAIQEIVAAKNHYKADKAMVITNSSFTRSAIDLSLSNNVELWDGVKLRDIIESLKTKKKNDFEKRSYVLKKGKDVQIIQILCPFCKQQFDYKVTEKDMTEEATFKTKCSYCGIIVDGTVTSRKETWTCKYCGKKF